MGRFWMSWNQTTDDERPIKVPPKLEVMGYWCSGTRLSDMAATMCALVVSSNVASAKKVIKKYWPEASDWRFAVKKSDDWTTGDRFPLKEPPRRG